MADAEQSLVPRPLAVVTAWVWRLLLLAFATVIVAVAAFELRLITVPIFVAILLTTLLLPPVHFLRRRGLGAGLATAIVFILVIAIIVGLAFAGSATLSDQFALFGPQIDTAIDKINNWLRTGPLQLSDAQINQYITQATDSLKTNSSSLQAGVVSSATIIGEILTGLLVSIILTFYFVKDGESMSDGLINLFPERHRQVLHAGAHRAFTTLAGYLRGIAMTGIVDSVCIGIGLWIIGVPLVVPLMILTFFGAFFPLVGATVAGALAASIALVNGGIGDALWVIAVVLFVQQLEGHILQPLLVGRAVKLAPPIIIICLVSGSVIAGLLGAFLAVPLVAVLISVIREVKGKEPATVQVAPTIDQ